MLEFKPVPMVVSLRGVKAAARRLRGGLRASLDSSTLKRFPAAIGGIESPCLEKTQSSSRRVEAIPAFICYKETTAMLRIGRSVDTSPPNGNCETQVMYENVNIRVIIDLLDLRLRL